MACGRQRQAGELGDVLQTLPVQCTVRTQAAVRRQPHVPGNTILAPLPGFVMYEMSARLQGLAFVGVPLTTTAGLLVALGCYVLINKTRVGMLIRAGSSNPTIVAALGVNIKLLNATIFALGAALAGVAGLMSGPILSVQTGMGEPILITAMIVIVIGGIGSVRGAFYSAIIVGLIDTAGRAFLPMMLREFLDRSTAQAAGPALASMLTCIFMATVLALKPAGLFPVKNQ